MNRSLGSEEHCLRPYLAFALVALLAAAVWYAPLGHVAAAQSQSSLNYGGAAHFHIVTEESVGVRDLNVTMTRTTDISASFSLVLNPDLVTGAFSGQVNQALPLSDDWSVAVAPSNGISGVSGVASPTNGHISGATWLNITAYDANSVLMLNLSDFEIITPQAPMTNLTETRMSQSGPTYATGTGWFTLPAWDIKATFSDSQKNQCVGAANYHCSASTTTPLAASQSLSVAGKFKSGDPSVYQYSGEIDLKLVSAPTVTSTTSSSTTSSSILTSASSSSPTSIASSVSRPLNSSSTSPSQQLSVIDIVMGLAVVFGIPLLAFIGLYRWIRGRRK